MSKRPPSGLIGQAILDRESQIERLRQEIAALRRAEEIVEGMVVDANRPPASVKKKNRQPLSQKSKPTVASPKGKSRSTVTPQIVAILEASTVPLRTAEVLAELKKRYGYKSSENAVSVALGAAAKAGKIRRVEFGYYGPANGKFQPVPDTGPSRAGAHSVVRLRDGDFRCIHCKVQRGSAQSFTALPCQPERAVA